MKKVFSVLLLLLLPYLLLGTRLVAQQSGSYQIKVTAGGLREQLPQGLESVVSLTLSGELNSSDLTCIRELVNLETLDLLKTHIIVGGDGYTSELLAGETITVKEPNALPGALLAEHTKIRSVTLPQGLKSLGEYAFYGATQLASVNCPTTLQTLGAFAFAKCTSLTAITLNANIKKLSESLFEGCTSLESVTKSKATHIGKKAFKGCRALKKFSLVTGLLEIGDEAFADCSTLEMINIPSSTKQIGVRAFRGCTSLYILFFKTGVEEIGDAAFAGCTALTTIYLPSGIKRLPQEMFAGCTSLKEVTMGKGLMTIGPKALANCTSLSRILIESTTPPSCNPETFDGVAPLSAIDLLVPSAAEATYRADDSWKTFHIIGIAGNYKGDEVVTIRVKEGTNTPFRFGLRIAQPYFVELGNGTFLKGAPGTKITAKNQVQCNAHGSVIKLYTTPAAVTSFLINDLNDNDIESITFRTPELDYLWLSNSLIKELDLSTLTKLQFLNLTNNASLKSLQLDRNVALSHLDISLCEALSAIDLSRLKELTFLGASMINISSWDLSSNTKLQMLDLMATPIRHLDISMLKDLREIKLTKCGLEGILFPAAPNLQMVYLEDNKLEASTLNKIYESLPQRNPGDKAKIFIKGNVGAEASITSIATNKNWIIDVQGSEPSIPDEEAVNFFTAAKTVKVNILTKDSETLLVDWGDGGEPERISSQAGIINQLSHQFATQTPQHEVKVYAHTITSIVSPLFSTLKLTYLDVSRARSLEVLSLPYDNDLLSVDLSTNLQLTSIDLSGCKLNALTLPKDLSKLRSLKLNTNDLKSIYLSGATSLEVLSAASNKLSTIDLSSCTQLKKLNLNLNGLSEIIWSESLTQLEEVDIARNNLPFSMRPPKGDLKEYKYNQYWYDIPERLINGRTIDLSAETLAQGISSKKELTTFEWYLRESADSKVLISESLYTSDSGRFTFSSKLFGDKNTIDLFVLMRNPGFPEINTKTGGLQSGLVKLTKGESSDVDPSTFEDKFEGLYENAFLKSTQLTEILLPRNTRDIRANAFAQCPSLKGVVFYTDATVVASSFDDQEGLKVYVPTEAIKATFEQILHFSKAEVVVGIPTSLIPPEEDGEISIATNQSSLTLRATSRERAHYTIYSSCGELIAQGSLEPGETKSYSLRPSQIYFLKSSRGPLKVIIP